MSKRRSYFDNNIERLPTKVRRYESFNKYFFDTSGFQTNPKMPLSDNKNQIFSELNSYITDQSMGGATEMIPQIQSNLWVRPLDGDYSPAYIKTGDILFSMTSIMNKKECVAVLNYQQLKSYIKIKSGTIRKIICKNILHKIGSFNRRNNYINNLKSAEHLPLNWTDIETIFDEYFKSTKTMEKMSFDVDRHKNKESMKNEELDFLIRIKKGKDDGSIEDGPKANAIISNINTLIGERYYELLDKAEMDHEKKYITMLKNLKSLGTNLAYLTPESTKKLWQFYGVADTIGNNSLNIKNSIKSSISVVNYGNCTLRNIYKKNINSMDCLMVNIVYDDNGYLDLIYQFDNPSYLEKKENDVKYYDIISDKIKTERFFSSKDSSYRIGFSQFGKTCHIKEPYISYNHLNGTKGIKLSLKYRNAADNIKFQVVGIN